MQTSSMLKGLQRADVYSLDVGRLATLASLLTGNALNTAIRARREDVLSGAGLESALGIIARIDALTDRLIDLLTPQQPQPRKKPEEATQ